MSAIRSLAVRPPAQDDNDKHARQRRADLTVVVARFILDLYRRIAASPDGAANPRLPSGFVFRKVRYRTPFRAKTRQLASVSHAGASHSHCKSQSAGGRGRKAPAVSAGTVARPQASLRPYT